ncbi:putative tetratricopeptide repeat protein [Roseibium sp. TrichSKD4]|uniref:tetratricopeptide repeat protein n=1 Tax=Roseibium sp. TrichSKD4 TaxID=744980 RepID=UPI0001E56AB7|nr:tetratricopeptide repeat protein [Roseibium sp. TrichSKD4]EFO31149.1 putative tetratricopeptide repeat protein [Roseibium sp. TrichSKD4]
MANGLPLCKILAACLALLVSACSNGEGFQQRSGQQKFENVVDIALYKKAIRDDPNNINYLLILANKYVETTQWSESAASFREALRLSPNNTYALVGYAHSLLALGQYQDALSLADRSITHQRTSKNYLIKGIASDGMQDYQSSDTIYRQIIRQHPRNLAARNNLALSMALQGKSEAYEIMREVAFSPDAQLRHRHNLLLVGALLGRRDLTKRDAAAFSISSATEQKIFEIGQKARKNGVKAFGIASAKDP